MAVVGVERRSPYRASHDGKFTELVRTQNTPQGIAPLRGVPEDVKVRCYFFFTGVGACFSSFKRFSTRYCCKASIRSFSSLM